MKRMAFLVTCMWLLVLPVYAQDVAEFSDYYNGKRYDARITKEQLEQMPSWVPTDQNPPLSPRKAMELGSSYLPTLVGQAKKWWLVDLTLVKLDPGDKWVYLAKFAGPPPPGSLDTVIPTMRVLVLMNGQVIHPVISKYKSGY